MIDSSVVEKFVGLTLNAKREVVFEQYGWAMRDPKFKRDIIAYFDDIFFGELRAGQINYLEILGLSNQPSFKNGYKYSPFHMQPEPLCFCERCGGVIYLDKELEKGGLHRQCTGSYIRRQAIMKINKGKGYTKKSEIIMPPEIEYGSCCNILQSHADALKDDPERLSTDFIKRLSQCECKDGVN